MTPRRITKDDTKAHEEIHALLHSAFAYMVGRIDPPSSLNKLTLGGIASHAANHEVWRVADEGKIIACVFLQHDEDALYLGKLATAKSHRRTGLAKRLIQLAEQRAQALFYDRLELQTRIELTENHMAFAKMGFLKTAEGCHAGFTRPTEITMQKQL